VVWNLAIRPASVSEAEAGSVLDVGAGGPGDGGVRPLEGVVQRLGSAGRARQLTGQGGPGGGRVAGVLTIDDLDPPRRLLAGQEDLQLRQGLGSRDTRVVSEPRTA
jgi:hypothetical protein